MPKIERTEDDILARAPIKVQLGGKTYEVSPLTIMKGRAWRQQLVDAVAQFATETSGEITNGRLFARGLAFTLIKAPEKLADLVFAFAPDLPRRDIEENATEEELAVAFGQIMDIAFPFGRQLSQINLVLKGAATSSQSAQHTN